MREAPVTAAARALYVDATAHIKPSVRWEWAPLVLRQEWERKASVALAAAGVRRG